MASITLKNVPQPLLRQLKAQAARHRRSLNHEVIVCLESLTQSVPVDVDSLLAKARQIRRIPKKTRLTDRTLTSLKVVGRP
jgi:plasmid stability protein